MAIPMGSREDSAEEAWLLQARPPIRVSLRCPWPMEQVYVARGGSEGIGDLVERFVVLIVMVGLLTQSTLKSQSPSSLQGP
ncbi:hypothetical protein BDP81DRAFT_411088 [Colletotrichum phormii]|uniref:Uncharacterized protein n=1 Tax=Colletotrichum phormii TaxID=359342 RepID=A0AAJ0E9N4_9PEZI|nr:uncharacterized protein BDP81DRAFT_411088 [Colletotrichum phormii]KAK1623010.1 hypothetical protein BDP81DRAFT_411088 [Colletotrichum phormii]